MKLFNLLLAGAALASEVHVLTTDTFDDFISSNPLVLAEFYAPWCGHCKALAPEYDDASEILAKNKDYDIKLAKVDCTENEQICSSLDIRGYPTIMVFRGDKDKVSPYSGGRKSDLIVSYMLKQALPSVTTVDSASLDSFKELDEVTVLGVFDKKADNETFGSVADTLRDKFVFGSTNDAAVKKALGIKSTPALVVFKKFDDPVSVFDGDFKAEDISSYIQSVSVPLIGEIGPNTYADYAKSGLPLLYVFVETDEHRSTMDKILRPLAIKHKKAINIGMIDAAAFGAHAPNVNLKANEWPAMAIEDFATGSKFPHPQDGEISVESASEWIRDFVEGALQPTVKSEEVPESQPDHVYTLVGKTFKEIVVDSDKDVLVEFYAPWCGHCKNLAPTYESLAELYKDNDKVVVAKIDHTANEVPGLEIRGYPTIKLFPAGSETPVDYDGARTLEAFAAFIKEKGTHGIDGLASNETKPKADKAEKKSKKKAKKAKKAKKDAKAEL